MRRPALTPIAILVASLLVLTFIAVAAAPAGSDDQDPSSTASGRAGTLALYDWLQDLGYGAHRVYSTFDLAGSDVLISADPLDVNPYSGADDRVLESFLRGGGEAILAVSDPTAVPAVLQPLGIEAVPTGAASATPSEPFPGSAGVASVPLEAPGAASSVWSFSGGGAGLVPLLDSGGSPVVAEMLVGSGRLFLLGSEYPLSNDGLRRGDSAPLVLSLLGSARGRSIAFDEVHHLAPVGIDDYGLSAVFQGPLLLAVVLAVIVVLLLLVTGSRRLGRPLPGRDPTQVPTVLDHVASVGHLLSASRERGGVAHRYAEELKLRVGRVSGVDPHLADLDFVAGLAGFGADLAGEVGRLLSEARRLAGARPTETELLGLARRVDALEQAWGAAAIR